MSPLVMNTYGVLNCHSIRSRGIVGQHVFIEMHMVVAPRDIESAHQITTDVEQALVNVYGPVRITIHLEPYDHIELLESYLQKPPK